MFQGLDDEANMTIRTIIANLCHAEMQLLPNCLSSGCNYAFMHVGHTYEFYKDSFFPTF